MSHHRAERLRRKESFQAARASIETLSDAELKNLAFELGREMGARSLEVSELRLRLEAVRAERERRRTTTSEGICISDHAVLRYLERHKNLDVSAAREEIVAMARRAGKFDSGAVYATRTDEESGMIMGINELSGVVTTVFNEREATIMDVPKRVLRRPRSNGVCPERGD